MIEVVADFWSVLGEVHVITTNGDVNSRGEAVMGRGCAKEAAQRFDGLTSALARYLRRPEAHARNHVHDLGVWSAIGSGRAFHIVTFPVKHHWHERADLELIERSAEELFDLATEHNWKRVITVRAGCGNGGLEWKDVRPVVRSWFSGGRFIVCHK